MEAVAAWATVICVCACAGLVLELLAPNGTMDKICLLYTSKLEKLYGR